MKAWIVNDRFSFTVHCRQQASVLNNGVERHILMLSTACHSKHVYPAWLLFPLSYENNIKIWPLWCWVRPVRSDALLSPFPVYLSKEFVVAYRGHTLVSSAMSYLVSVTNASHSCIMPEGMPSWARKQHLGQRGGPHLHHVQVNVLI